MTITKAERKLVELFLKTVGGGLGLYNSGSKEFKPNVESEGVYQANLEIVRSALKDGWTAADLNDHICYRYSQGDRAALLSEILTKRPKSDQIAETDNLLEEGNDLHHPFLLTWKGRPTYAVVDDVMLPVSRGTLIRKTSLTLGELVDYYFSQVKTANHSKRRPTIVSQMRWLFSQNTLDEILFAIDVAGTLDRDVSVFELSNYMSQARNEVQRCRARQSER